MPELRLEHARGIHPQLNNKLEMIKYIRFASDWCVTGSGPAPVPGPVNVTTKAGTVKQETVTAVLMHGQAGWIAAIAPRAGKERPAQPWKNYDEVGMHGNQ